MAVKIQTIKDIRLYLAAELSETYPVAEINSISNIIIKSILGLSQSQMLYMNDQKVASEKVLRINNICNDLKTGKPLQYVLGETVFYNCTIRTTGAALIPRPETEELVDLIIRENRDFHGNIIDIGTGSGCIAVALSCNLPEAAVTGIDVSDDALILARENAALNNVNVTYLKGDILSSDLELPEDAGIIVSNPPYVRNSEKKLMNRNVLSFEPHIALFVPDSDPLIFYRAIISRVEKSLLAGGRLYFEINEAMGEEMLQLLKSSGYSEIVIVEDLNGKQRIIKGTKDV